MITSCLRLLLFLLPCPTIFSSFFVHVFQNTDLIIHLFGINAFVDSHCSQDSKAIWYIVVYMNNLIHPWLVWPLEDKGFPCLFWYPAQPLCLRLVSLGKRLWGEDEHIIFSRGTFRINFCGREGEEAGPDSPMSCNKVLMKISAGLPWSVLQLPCCS